jgi:hypothetical protein
MRGHGLSSGVAFSLSTRTAPMVLAQLLEILIIESNKNVVLRRNRMTLIHKVNPLTQEVRVGVTAPYLKGMLLLQEAGSDENSLDSDAFYTMLNMVYVGTNEVASSRRSRHETKVIKDLRFFAHALPAVVVLARYVVRTMPEKV